MALDEALASSRQAVTAMETQMHTQQQESARLLSDAEAEVRRLRKSLDEAVASKDLREKAAMDLVAAQRDAREAEQRHVTHERRLLADVDRERVAARQAAAELAKEQKARTADLDAARTAQAAAQQALQAEKSAHRDSAVAWSRKEQEGQVELATPPRARRGGRAAGRRPGRAVGAPARAGRARDYTSEGRRVIDHMVQTPDGRIVANEIKSGNGTRSAAQRAKDGAMAVEGGVPIGQNAPGSLRGRGTSQRAGSLEQFVRALQPLRHRYTFNSETVAYRWRDLHQSHKALC